MAEPWTAHAVGSTVSGNISSSAKALEVILSFDTAGIPPDVKEFRRKLDIEFKALLNRYGDLPVETLSIPRGDGTTLSGELHRPEGWDGKRTVLYFHGGGYIGGSPAVYRTFVAEISKRTKAQVLAIDYRLAPEHILPAPVEDAVLAYEYVVQKMGIRPSDIAIGGDSAGGGLTALTLLAIRDSGKVDLPAATFLISPWTDLTCSSDSMYSKANEDLVLRSDLKRQASIATGTDLEDSQGKRKSPRFSPLFADLSGLKTRLLVQVGSSERLLDDARRFANKAREAGANVRYSEWQRMQHVWPVFFHTVPEADVALDEIVAFILSSQ